VILSLTVRAFGVLGCFASPGVGSLAVDWTLPHFGLVVP